MSYYRTQQLICKKVTPQDAQSFLELNTFEGQRKLNTHKANQYARLMAVGKMRPVDIDVAIIPGGVRVLMNGQHVCTAIMLYKKPFDARIQYWKCETNEDAWHLFGTFDVHASRTEQQIIRAARPFLGELSDVPLSILQACGSALMMIATSPPQFGTVKAEKSQKADMLVPHKEEVLFVAKMASDAGKERRGVFRVPAVAAMIQTYRKSARDANDFWYGVATGELLERHTPQYRLANVLLLGASEKSVLGGSSRNRVFYSYCIAYWNSWRKKEKRSSVKINAMKSIPTPI